MGKVRDYTSDELMSDVREIIKGRNLDDPIQQSIIRLTLSDKYRRSDIKHAIVVAKAEIGYIPYPVGGTPPQ